MSRKLFLATCFCIIVLGWAILTSNPGASDGLQIKQHHTWQDSVRLKLITK